MKTIDTTQYNLNKIMYVTYLIKGLNGNNTPIAVSFTQQQLLVGQDIFFDACSLVGLKNVRFNNCGRIRKDAIVIDYKQHYSYDWEVLQKQYFDKYFNPSLF